MKVTKSTVAYFCLWLALAALVIYISYDINQEKTIQTSPSPTPLATIIPTATPEVEEVMVVETEDEYLKGMWVPYMDLSTQKGTVEEFTDNFIEILNGALNLGVNNLFVHVRPFSDALYESELFPWSHIITGEQGVDPGYDPLQIMIDLCHDNNIKIHAWINPLRVKLQTIPESFGANNPYTVLSSEHPYYFMQTESGLFLNPAYMEVRTLIIDGAVEIIKKYDVDGIHFDDYFYPSDITEQDKLAYQDYLEKTDNPTDLLTWRTSNINALISGVYREIKNENSDIVFGISPQANLGNNKSTGADVYTWCSVVGYIDYICPQIYFSYEHPTLPFLTSLDEWNSIPKHSELDMYIGLALYKAGTNSDSGTWLNKTDIVASQILDVEEDGHQGYILYDSVAMRKEEAQQEVQSIMAILD